MARTKFTPNQIEENKISFFNRDQARTLGRAIEEMLVRFIGEKYSLRCSYEGGSYDSDRAVLKFEFIPKEKKHPEERTYLELKDHLSLPDLFSTFTDERGEEMMIIGLKGNRPKNCICLKRTRDDHRYKCSLKYLQVYFPDVRDDLA
jgi:hypothetical protein